MHTSRLRPFRALSLATTFNPSEELTLSFFGVPLVDYLSRMSDQSLDVPTTVKNLLLSTKQLQYTLEEWSIGRADDEEVSNVYVKIGTEFNLVVRAFGMYRIDMSELYPIPTDLREVLEQCLAEDASPQVLALYLPGVKKVFISLLKGLRDRQLMWRDRDGSMNGTGTFRSFT